MDYIDRIKKIKSEKKITNDRLSELTGIPLGTLSKLLAGISDSPKLVNVIAIANALNCSLDYLVSGIPQNDHNYTLTEEEIRLVEQYRSLDHFGQDLILTVAEKEGERVKSYVIPEASNSRKKRETSSVSAGNTEKTAKILEPTFGRIAPIGEKRTLLLYDLPVSAGPGVYLDDTAAEEIHIPNNEKTQLADFALRISGNSMEPKFHDGDVLLVQNTEAVEVGELGVFILDGNGYFKKYGGDCLISLNPEYGDILLKEYAEAVCCGRVVGKLRRK
ncbi:MAG: helix-turn-helix domain-containing protein [Clostridia bacterium]|nr:helix-turn-helix domain-containing protein [Clostridia bacterium]